MKTKTIKIPYKEEVVPLSVLQLLVKTYYDYQDQRLRTASRILLNCQRHNITEEKLAQYGVTQILEKVQSLENDIKSLITPQLKQYRIYNEYLSKIYGIGPILSAGLISYIGEIKKFEHVSSIWQYSGLGFNRFCPECKHPTYVYIEIENKEGKHTKVKMLKPKEKCEDCGKDTIPIIQKRTIGYISGYNEDFKVLAWKCANSFVKQQVTKSGYRRIYDLMREDEERKNPTKIKKDGRTFYNDGHKHNRALRKTVKIFLAHLHTRWCLIEGIEPSEPYAEKMLGHKVIKSFIDK